MNIERERCKAWEKRSLLNEWGTADRAPSFRRAARAKAEPLVIRIRVPMSLILTFCAVVVALSSCSSESMLLFNV